MRLQGAPPGPAQLIAVFKVQPAERVEAVLNQNRVHPVVYREALKFSPANLAKLDEETRNKKPKL